ncbi:MAG: 2-dehydropantoate 2-reductase [Caldilineaceae bacterium]
MENRLSITIFGIGALGTLFGSRLHPWADVTLVGHWPEQIAAVTQNGLRVTELDGIERHYDLHVTSRPAPMTLAIILVKSAQTAAAVAQIGPLLQPDGLAITLQNGLGNLELLTAAVGPQRAAVGVTSQGATVLRPGHIRHAGAGPTALALQPSNHPLLPVVTDLFNRARLATELVEQADGVIWSKLIVNVALNPLTALLETPNGALADDPWMRRLGLAAAREATQVAHALGVELPFADADQHVLHIARLTAHNHSSMFQDMRRGARTEIDALCGAVADLGETCGVATPVNRAFWRLVRAKEAGEKRDFRGELDRLL